MDVSQFQHLSINLQNGIWDGCGGNQFKAVMFCLEVRIFQSKEWGYISKVTNYLLLRQKQKQGWHTYGHFWSFIITNIFV